jgi:hypothetical protein
MPRHSLDRDRSWNAWRALGGRSGIKSITAIGSAETRISVTEVEMPIEWATGLNMGTHPIATCSGLGLASANRRPSGVAAYR